MATEEVRYLSYLDALFIHFELMHLMGEPKATRHLVVKDREAVLSPSWSIHAGVGTSSYRFVWAMGGDNQVFSDMDAIPIAELR